MSSDFGQQVRFKELLLEPVRNGIYKQKEFHGRGCKIINMGELFGHPRLFDVPMKRVELTEKEMGKALVQAGDLLFARRSLVASGAGKCSIVKEVAEPTTFESSIIRARPDLNKASSDYLYYYFVSPLGRENMGKILRQMAVSGITGSDLMELMIDCPSLDKQHQIASLMIALDDRIALLRETNTTLEAISQALFKSWFVDFDPVHAKQQGIAPEGLDEATAALFPDGFEESELGLLPRGWRVGVLGDIAKTVKKQLQPSALHSAIHYVGLEHIPRKSLSLSDWGSAEGLESAKAAFTKDDILFGKLRPYFHKVVIAPFNGVCSTDILVCQSTIPAYYGLTVMQLFSKPLIDYAERLSNGAKMPRVNWKDLVDYPICIPPETLAENYSEIIKPITLRMAENVHMSKTLATLRDTLLPRLISGQLRLPEAEAMREAIAE